MLSVIIWGFVFATNPKPYTFDLKYGVKPPNSEYGISTVEEMFKHLEAEID